MIKDIFEKLDKCIELHENSKLFDKYETTKKYIYVYVEVIPPKNKNNDDLSL